MSKRLVSVALGLILCAGLLNTAAMIGVGQTSRERKAEGSKQAARPSLPPAEATITLNEQFMNSLLDAVFTNLRPPSFPLSLTRTDAPATTPTAPETANALASSKPINQCASEVVLEREIGGVKTAVRFQNGRIVAPLAFTGTYNTGLLGLPEVSGLGRHGHQSRIQPRATNFERARQRRGHTSTGRPAVGKQRRRQHGSERHRPAHQSD